jgi:probable phosphoglycerate mutase
MKIYIIRHSETIEWKNNIILWYLWWNLSEVWIGDSHKLWNFFNLKDFNIKKIITSALKRSIDTGNIINEYLKVDLFCDNLLNERNSWVAEWKNESEINWELYETKQLIYRKHIWWESFIEVRNRAKKSYEKFNAYNTNDSILIITHSVFILMLLSIINKISIKNALKIDIKDKIVVFDTLKKTIEFIKIY